MEKYTRAEARMIALVLVGTPIYFLYRARGK